MEMDGDCFGVVIFVLALIIFICSYQSGEKKMKDYMKENDADPNSFSKSDNWYREHGKM